MARKNVTILEKSDNGQWSAVEFNALVAACVEVESLRSKPSRLVAVNKPLSGETFEAVLGHSDFTAKEVDYYERWD